MTTEPIWSAEDLAKLRDDSKSAFRRERLEEPLEEYATQFESWQGVFETLLESTVDLSLLGTDQLLEIVTKSDYLDAFRYLAGPPISRDDLQTLAEVESIAPTRLRGDHELVSRLAQVVMDGLDRRRFPWVSEGREATEPERKAAILASASLRAYQAVQTWRRNEARRAQEDLVKDLLLECGFSEVDKRDVDNLSQAPANGQFCGEAKFGTRKADIIAGLWDGRKAAIECKVSNSEVNSVKRLNNDAAVKAQNWKQDFGARNVVAIAVLSGVYKLENLQEAQNRGLTLFWAHDFAGMKAWLNQVREQAG